MKDPVADETLQYLLIGTDAGDPTQDQNGRSDSLMLLHLNEERDEAYVISIPRNLMVTIPGKGEQRINAAYALGQAPMVVRTLEQLTGSRIDHVAMIDFRGFVNLTETLEGVTVRNRTAFSSHGYDYPVGDITLSGDAALWYVRERRGLPSELIGPRTSGTSSRRSWRRVCRPRWSPTRCASPSSSATRPSRSRWTRR